MINNACRATNARAPLPLGESNRLGALDVLRGAALLGILAINIQLFAGSPVIAFNIPLRVVAQSGAHPMWDELAMYLQWTVFEGKMRGLFSLLFGAGAALMLERLEQLYGRRACWTIAFRRYAVLALFGLLHGVLIWSGDVLLIYALTAFLVVLPLRGLPGKWLIGAGLCVTLIGGSMGVSNAFDLGDARVRARTEQRVHDVSARHLESQTGEHATPPAARAAYRERLARLDATPSRHVSYRDLVSANASAYRGFVTAVFVSGWFLETVGLFMIGMGLARSGFFASRLPAASYLAMAGAGYAISIGFVVAGLRHAARYDFSEAVTTVSLMSAYEGQVAAGALAHAAFGLWLIGSDRLRVVRTALSAVGRLALTNYIATSLLCQAMFAWPGFVVGRDLDHHLLILAVLAVWAVIIAASLCWLRYFRLGPLEWCWRSLTYGSVRPFRMSAPAARRR